MKTVLIIGCGDIGTRVARLYLTTPPEPIAVSALARGDERARQLAAQGIQVVQGDLSQPATLGRLATAGATVFYLAPPPSDGETDPLLRNFLAAIASDALPEKIILLSTTAVYGDCGGQWIDEAHVTQPDTARGRRRLDAELALRQWCAASGVDYVILRVGGIYGPGRWPLARLQQGLPILRESESPYTNRIHQDDLSRICVAAAERGIRGEVYNVADGQPGTMSGYFKAVAQHFGLPLPPEVTPEEAHRVMSAGMLSYLKESRRIDNHKLLAELGVELMYPDLAAGLAAEAVP